MQLGAIAERASPTKLKKESNIAFLFVVAGMRIA
jgi:hypothetical protein